ncbi:FtsX-like permease family protein [Bacillus ndiopicus]|uniref:FtsX-like permease family protein n=1 Tax=Bacillus ndiopicus TaxID=1347368 RepID=UPI0005A832AD|nr:ABC transporter permease [Bacillus ndiopicus]
MNFQSIMKKNMLFHARKYVSIYFVYALIVMLLFLFASLLYNQAVITALEPTPFYQNLQLALVMIAAFSAIFITYATISFLKYRGQEFGTYITLGMTSKQLLRLLSFEQAIITGISLITGLLSGIVLGKLFYLGFQQFVRIPKLTFQLNVQSFGITIAIFLTIIIVTFFLSAIYIKRVSLVQLIRAKMLKDTTKGSYLLGLTSIILFIASLWAIPYAMENRQEILLKIAIAFTLITPYFIIGAGILVVKRLLEKFPSVYQRHVLTLSNVTHRLRAFQTTLYLVMIMLGGSIVFIGLAYTLYATTEEINDLSNPYSYMYITSDEWQGLDEQSETFDFVMQSLTRQFNGEWRSPEQIAVVSKEQYEKYMQESISTPALITNEANREPFITPIMWGDKELKDVQYISRSVTNLTLFGFNLTQILVVDDPSLYQGEVFTAHKLKQNVSKAEAQAFEENLKEKNKVDEIPWQYAPISKEMELETDFQRTGLTLFISSFVGILFVLASGIILFYKVLTDLPAQKEYMQSLERIGLRTKEKKKLIRNELRILFFTPFFLSVAIGSYYFYLLFSSFPNIWDYMERLGVVLVVFFVVQFGFYCWSRGRCEGEV